MQNPPVSLAGVPLADQEKTSFGKEIDSFVVKETGCRVYVYRNAAGGFTFTSTEISQIEDVVFDDCLTSIFTMKAVMRYYEGLAKTEQPCSDNPAH